MSGEKIFTIIKNGEIYTHQVGVDKMSALREATKTSSSPMWVFRAVLRSSENYESELVRAKWKTQALQELQELDELKLNPLLCLWPFAFLPFCFRNQLGFYLITLGIPAVIFLTSYLLGFYA